MAKKNPKKKSVKKISSPELINEPKKATIEKAANGFVVSRGYGEKTHVAKSLLEAVKIQAKLLK